MEKTPKKIRFFNTDGRELQNFLPINNDGSVGMYCCGPTVYNYAHIGNLRAYTHWDILRRTLERFGYKVTHVMNITDVGHLTDDGDDGEDKMVKGARERGMSVYEIAQFFTDAFFRDIDRLNIIRPTVSCRATEHIQEMIELIKKLDKNGLTYIAGGNVYFDTSKFPSYGKLALLDKQELQHGARVEVDPNKKNPHDFVLWFTKSKFENQAMIWDSPWGRGYPGWHIECSAMSSKYLGEHFDIHAGGIDHIPVHHTNEIAQSEGAFGHKWVNYWLHNEFLIMKDGKMSKSKGGFLTLQKLIDDGYDPLDYRYFLLGGHYRSQLVFSEESLNGAKSARKSIINKIRALYEESGVSDITSGRIQKNNKENTDINKNQVGKNGNDYLDYRDFSEPVRRYLENFDNALAEDLNTPRALAEFWKLLKDENIPAEEKIQGLFSMDGVLGLKLKEYADNDGGGEESEIDEELKHLLEKRNKARKEKNWAVADSIRNELQEKGWRIIDAPGGSKLEKI